MFFSYKEMAYISAGKSIPSNGRKARIDRSGTRIQSNSKLGKHGSWLIWKSHAERAGDFKPKTPSGSSAGKRSRAALQRSLVDVQVC